MIKVCTDEAESGLIGGLWERGKHLLHNRGLPKDEFTLG
jgi:hypothetical protein